MGQGTCEVEAATGCGPPRSLLEQAPAQSRAGLCHIRDVEPGILGMWRRRREFFFVGAHISLECTLAQLLARQ
jgi:hypothetical protein